jgi:hypothetical protein
MTRLEASTSATPEQSWSYSPPPAILGSRRLGVHSPRKRERTAAVFPARHRHATTRAGREHPSHPPTRHPRCPARAVAALAPPPRLPDVATSRRAAVATSKQGKNDLNPSRPTAQTLRCRRPQGRNGFRAGRRDHLTSLPLSLSPPKFSSSRATNFPSPFLPFSLPLLPPV